MVPQSGAGASLVINLVGSDDWHWNLLAGVFKRGWGSQMSVPELSRRLDTPVGTSLEARIHGQDWFTVDYRAFLPDPGLSMSMNSIYSRCLYDSFKEGMLWLGYKRTW